MNGKHVMFPFISSLRVALFFMLSAIADAQYECFDAPGSSPPRTLPLCGNGRLDAGEVCDDGNQNNFDGCNAFCSAFDGMSAAGTLAGVPTECGDTGQILSGSTGQIRFCKLQAIASGIDGSYVILADGATVLRYDLFTDLEKGNIRQLDASVVRFCL
jgi:cysteine-rich repeat protein